DSSTGTTSYPFSLKRNRPQRTSRRRIRRDTTDSSSSTSAVSGGGRDRPPSGFPDQERYRLTAQLRRAVVSVPTNIVEGSKRQSGQEFARFLNIAEASLAETGYLLLLSRDLGYLDAAVAKSLLAEV